MSATSGVPSGINFLTHPVGHFIINYLDKAKRCSLVKLAETRDCRSHSEAGWSNRLTGTSQNAVRKNAKLDPGKGDALALIQLGTYWLRSCCEEKALEILVGRELSVRLCQQTANSASDYVSRSMAKRLREVIAP